MTTQLVKEDEELFTILFNEYCLILYEKTYPLTDNNVFNYFVDFYKYHYSLEYNYSDLNLNKLETVSFKTTKDNFYLTFNNERFVSCMRSNSLFVPNLYKSFNNYLKEISNEGKYS